MVMHWLYFIRMVLRNVTNANLVVPIEKKSYKVAAGKGGSPKQACCVSSSY